MNTSDIKCFAYPNVLSRRLGLLANHLGHITQPGQYSELEKAGFLLERDDDLTRCLCERLGGHYMDIGASKKIADGLVCFTTFLRVVWRKLINSLLLTDKNENWLIAGIVY